MFRLGDYVVNFGVLGRVLDVRLDGSFILENSRFGRWVADPASCSLYIIPCC